eukprot:179316_1
MSVFKFYQHDANIYYTNRYYKKVKSIRESISKQGIPSSKVPNCFQIITDFDRTLTHPLSYQCHGLIATFTELTELQDAVKHLFNFKKLYPNEPPQNWWIKYHDEMTKCPFQYHMLSKLISVDDRVYMRDHCKQFFHYCESKNIPILIVSAGIANLIQCILEKYELVLSNVHLMANRIFWKCDNTNDINECFNGNGFYKKSTQVANNAKISHFGQLLTSFNKEDTYKYLKTEYFDRENIIQRRFVIFLGDARTDPHTMREVPNIEECIFIGFILPHRMKEIDIFLECYDVVIATRNASLKFVNDVLHAFLNGDHIVTESELKAEEFNNDEMDNDKISELQKIRAKTQTNTFTYSFTNLRVNNDQSDDQQLLQCANDNSSSKD